MNKFNNIVKCYCNKREDGLHLNSGQYFTLKFNVEQEGHYDFQIKHYHEGWDTWIPITVWHPDGSSLGYIPCLPHSQDAEITLYLKKGENIVEIKHNFGNEIIFYEINLIGVSKNIQPKLYPSADSFYVSEPRRAVIVLEKYNKELLKITCDNKIRQ